MLASRIKAPALLRLLRVPRAQLVGASRLSSSPAPSDSSDNKVHVDPHLWKSRTTSTLNSAEVDKFRALSSEWWDPEGKCKPLHSMNALRVGLVREGLAATGAISADKVDSARSLSGLRILDVGCGGGILSEALARLGAAVTALDAADENINVAKEHALKDPEVASNVEYLLSTVEDFAQKNPAPFDAVVASEVLEHVENQDHFVATCSSLLKPGGSLFVTTLNRTQQSYLFGILAAECVLGLLPVGTHDWNKFVKPEELRQWLETSGCQWRLIHGMFYTPFVNKWRWISMPTVNYAVHAVKL